MTWLMEILKNYLQARLLIKDYLMKHLILLKVLDMMNIKEVSLQWFIIFLIKKSASGAVKNEIIQNKKLTEEPHKPIIKKFERRKVHSSFIDNIGGVG